MTETIQDGKVAAQGSDWPSVQLAVSSYVLVMVLLCHPTKVDMVTC